MNLAQIFKDAAVRCYRGRIAPHLVGTLIMVAFSALLLFACYYSNGRGIPVDYEGKVVERWADYVETDEGSRPRFQLVVEGADGKRFLVKVDANIYESAKVGMRIRRRLGQVSVTDVAAPPGK